MFVHLRILDAWMPCGPQLGNALCLELPPFHEVVAAAQKGPLSMLGQPSAPRVSCWVCCSGRSEQLHEQGEIAGGPREEHGGQSPSSLSALCAHVPPGWVAQEVGCLLC